MDGLATDNGDGGPPRKAPLTSPQGEWVANGNLYIADSTDNRVQEIPRASGTQWGVSMVGGRVYTIVGSPAGVAGASLNGIRADRSLLFDPTGVTLDSKGDLYVADSENNRVIEVPSANGTQWGMPMTADHLYTVVGAQHGAPGDSASGTLAGRARLTEPTDVSTGRPGSGNLYVTDSVNGRVIEVAGNNGESGWGISGMQADHMYVVAGGGNSLVENDISATAATMTEPMAIDFSQGDVMFIADYLNNCVVAVADTTTTWGTRRLTADYMYVVAGRTSGLSGSKGDKGPATKALLDGPIAIELDNGRQLYIADSLNNRIKEVADTAHTEWGVSMKPNDIYTIAGSSKGKAGFAGDGGAAVTALLNTPQGVRLDASHDLEIADSGNNRVRKVDASTDVIDTIAGTGAPLSTVGDGGPALAAALSGPESVAADQAGNVYIADEGNNRVQEIAATRHIQFGISMVAGSVYTIAGSAAGVSGAATSGALATATDLDAPDTVALDPEGDVYIGDASARVFELYAANGLTWGHTGDTANHLYTLVGTKNEIGDSGDGGKASSALIWMSTGLSYTAAGDLVIADGPNAVVRVIAGSSGQTEFGLALTTADNIYRVAGAGSGTYGTSGDKGPATLARLQWPVGLATDASGDLYIADALNNRVQEVASARVPRLGSSSVMTVGDIYTVAGSSSGASGWTGDGIASTSALLDFPQQITIDPSGDLYIADYLNSRVQEVLANGDTETVAGSSTGVRGSAGDGGPATEALLDLTAGVALDSAGDLYIADNENDRLRVVEAGSVASLPTYPSQETGP